MLIAEWSLLMLDVIGAAALGVGLIILIRRRARYPRPTSETLIRSSSQPRWLPLPDPHWAGHLWANAGRRRRACRMRGGDRV